MISFLASLGPLVRFPFMPSTVIRSFSYDSEAKELVILFTTNRRYTYHDVPAAVAAGMRAAFSKGEYFNAYIRDHFRFTRQRRVAA